MEVGRLCRSQGLRTKAGAGSRGVIESRNAPARL